MWKKLLAMGLCLLLLTGCGIPAPEKTAEKDPLLDSHRFYKPVYMPLEDVSGQTDLHFYIGCVSGDRLYLVAECMMNGQRVDPLSDPENPHLISGEQRLYALDLETQSLTCLASTVQTALPPGADSGSLAIYGVSAGPDGSVWACQRVYACQAFTGTTGPLELVRYDPEGTVLETVALEAGPETEFTSFQMDSTGNAYGTDWNTVFCYDAQGRLLAQLPNEARGELISFSGGQVGLLCAEETDAAFRPIDPVSGAFGADVPLCAAAAHLYAGVDGYDYLYDLNGGAVYGCSAETGQGERLFSWMDYDVNGANVLACVFLPDGSVCAVDGYNQELVYLTPTDAAAVPEKEILTLACVGLFPDVQEEILRFNRTSQDVRIQVRDYSEYNTSGGDSAWETVLNTEIMAGKVPDLFLMESMVLGQYSAQGLLMDLWPMIDGDEELRREDLMTHVFDAMSQEGQLYGIADSFTIETLAGRRDVLGSRTAWTLAELQEARAKLPEGAPVFGAGDIQDGILFRCVGHNSGDFLDWSTGSCRFDTAEFRRILEFAGSFPAETTEEMSFFSQGLSMERVCAGEQLTEDLMIDSPADFLYAFRSLEDGASFVGYPSETGGSFFRMYQCMGISATAKNPEAAWRFVRTFLSWKHQKKLKNAFPTNRAAFEACMEDAMSGKIKYEVYAGGDNMETFFLQPMSEEEYARFMELYESCDRTMGYNDAVMSIVLDEASYYFSGEKTLDETVRVIQSRVSLYMAEQKVSN